MTTIVTIIICLLTLLAYFFDITAPKTRIPTVIIRIVIMSSLIMAMGSLMTETNNEGTNTLQAR